MNPKTSLTKSQIAKLCQLHGLAYHSSRRVEVGFSNEVHIINSQLVLKLYLGLPIRYQTELALLDSKTNFSKPQLIASGSMNESLDRKYIIMSLIEGTPLGHVWHKANQDQRHSLIKAHIASQQEINQLSASILPTVAGNNWYQILRADMDDDARSLKTTKIITTKEHDRALEIVDNLAGSLKASPLKVVNRDIHLDNILVNKNFDITGLIDFELVQLAALDYPLFVLKRMVDQPQQYAAEGLEKFIKVSDYQPLWSWYQELYPEMFAFERFEDRLRLYQLSNHLKLLKNWSQVPSIRLNFQRLLRTSG